MWLLVLGTFLGFIQRRRSRRRSQWKLSGGTRRSKCRSFHPGDQRIMSNPFSSRFLMKTSHLSNRLGRWYSRPGRWQQLPQRSISKKSHLYLFQNFGRCRCTHSGCRQTIRAITATSQKLYIQRFSNIAPCRYGCPGGQSRILITSPMNKKKSSSTSIRTCLDCQSGYHHISSTCGIQGKKTSHQLNQAGTSFRPWGRYHHLAHTSCQSNGRLSGSTKSMSTCVHHPV